MPDLITIDRGALLDLIASIEILTNLVQKGSAIPLEEQVSKLKYANKCIQTSMASYEQNNS